MEKHELLSAVDDIVTRAIQGIWTAAFGIVEKYNPQTCRCDIQLKCKTVVDGKEEKSALLLDVPLLPLGGGPWDVDVPVYDRITAKEAGYEPDIVLVIFLRHPLEGLVHDHQPHLPISGHLASFSLNNAVAVPVRLLAEGNLPSGVRKKHHSWKEVRETPSTRKQHHLRIFNRFWHQEIVLTNAVLDGRIILNVDPNSPKPYIDLVEDGPYFVGFQPPMANKYNPHTHVSSVGPGVDGPPLPAFHWFKRIDWSVTARVGNADEHPSNIHPECKHL